MDDKTSGTRYILVYRRPGPNISEELLDVLRDEIQGSKDPLVLGDLNMNLRAKVPQPRQLNTLLRTSGGLKQQISFATRPESNTIIDHVWSRRACRCTKLFHKPDQSAPVAVRVPRAS